jgi:ribosomal protein S18 acetylase RimI-like enzyme
MTVRTCPRVDQRALRRFLRRHADDLPPAAIRSATSKKKLGNWTVYCDNQGIAAAARFDPNDWYLCTLKNAAVRPDRRGQGLGRRLYQDVTKRALAERTQEGWPRCHVLAADVTHDNIASIKALQRAGFRPVNRFCWSKGEKPADILHYVRVAPTKGTECR